MRRFRAALAFLFLALVLELGLHSAGAQSTGELRGTVVDSSGAPVPGALVEIRSVVLIRPRQTGSLVDGEFRFPILPPGPYTILARQTGFLDATTDDVRIPLGETISVRMELKLSTTASVTVDSDVVPVVDTSSAKLGLSANERMLNNLPLNRNFASVASIVPGVGTDVLGPTVYGASSLENAFTTDDLNVTAIQKGGQGKLLPLEFVQEVEVRTGGYEAQYGRAMGGNINVVTKSGGNDFHGGAFGYYASDSLSSSDKHDADRDAAVIDRLQGPLRYDFGLSLGGPLFRDRLWFFGAYDRAHIDQDNFGVESLTYLPDGTIRANRTEEQTDRTSRDLFAIKLSWAPNPLHSVAVSVFGDTADYRGRHEFGPGTVAGLFGAQGRPTIPGPASARIVDEVTGGTDVSGRWDGFLGRVILQTQAGYHEEKTRDRSDSADRPAVIEQRQGRVQYLEGSGPDLLDDYLLTRSLLRANASVSLGRHEIKLGVDYGREEWKGTSRIGGGEAIARNLGPDGTLLSVDHIYYAAEPLDCTVRTDGRHGTFGFVDPTTCNSWLAAEQSSTARYGAHDVSVYLQDTFRPASNVTINIGLRHDYQQLERYTGVTWLTLTDQWSPRLSAAWDPTRAGKSKVFVSFGRYYQSLPEDLQYHIGGNVEPPYVVVSNFTSTSDKVHDPAALRGRPYAYLQTRYADFAVKGLEGTYQDEVSVGGELQVGTSWSLGLRGVYRSVGSAIEDRCDEVSGAYSPFYCVLINPGQGELGQLRDPLNPDCFEDYPANKQPRPCESVRAARFYRGLEVVAQHRPTKDLYIAASYVLSRLTGNYEGFIVSGGASVPQTAPAQSIDFDGGSLVRLNYGRLPNDHTHQLKLSGYYSLPFGLTTGVVASYASGQPLSVRSYASDGYALLAPRGTQGEMPSTYSVDLHLQYAVQLGSFSVSPVLDVFNVTNVQRATSRFQYYDTALTADQSKPPYTSPTNPRYGKDLTWQSPRLVRLAVKASF